MRSHAVHRGHRLPDRRCFRRLILVSLFSPRPVIFPARTSRPAPVFLRECLEALGTEFESLKAADIQAHRVQPTITGRLKPLLRQARDTIAEEFNKTNAGIASAQAYACFIDEMIIGLHSAATQMAYPSGDATIGDSLELVAIGGYGRGVLAPFSDIDLMFLLPYKQTPRAEQIVEFILYVLWDVGLKVGHCVRSVEDSIRLSKGDMVIRTTLLDMRPLAGGTALADDLARRFSRDVLSGTDRDYVAAKLEERARRLEKVGSSRYRLEPNIKEGKGGLRDLQLLLWIAAHIWRTADLNDLVERGIFLPREQIRFLKAEGFLWAVRTHLHYLVDRAEERLTFDVEQEIARRLGYTDRSGALEVERFMKHYFLMAKEVGELTRIFMASVEAELGSERKFLNFATSMEGFPLRQERISVPDGHYFERNPGDLLRIFYVAQKTGRGIHPRAERAISRSQGLINTAYRADSTYNELFQKILAGSKPDETLRAMNASGILGRFIPDWGRIVGQMQYDMYHVYTVDEHTLHAVATLDDLFSGGLEGKFPLASAMIKHISSRRELYLALILHDIGKGRGRSHSIVGEGIAAKFCRRLNLTEAETETVAWLVRWHLAMSDIALKRDLEDEQTITGFVDLIQSPERLRLLLVLTTCDIDAVGPGRWNNWKAGLLSELFSRASDRLSGMSSEGSDTRARIAETAARRALCDWSDRQFEQFSQLAYPGYWLSYDAATHARHAHMIAEAEAQKTPLSVWTRIDRDRAVTEITVYTEEHPLLFSQLAGAIAATGFSIADARISTLTNGMALDVFSVQDANSESGNVADRRETLLKMIEKSRSGKLELKNELARRVSALNGRARAIPVAQRVLLDNNASQRQTVVEVNGRDRPGLLYGLTTVFNEMNIQISSAKVATYGHRVVDVFYVTEPYGEKVLDGPKLHHLYERLMQVLAEQALKAA